jgi:ABC-type branched-subunit amino acid transport system ATPase component
MFGGVGTIWGPVIGAVILIPIGEILQAEFGARLPGIQGVIFGVAIVAVILLAPEGIFWRVRDLLRSRRAAPAPALAPAVGSADTAPPLPRQTPRAPHDAGEVILSVQGLSKSFGGLKAVQDVGFEVYRGEILGIIGPNGAGKTTLFNLLNGFLRPDAGRVVLDGRDMVGRKPHELCRAGVGRTFQVMRPFLRMSVADNVVIGAYVHAETDREARERAAASIREVGLGEVAGRLGGELTTKQLRLMELARALAGRPRLLLLDETLAGLGHAEVGDVLDVIRRLARSGITIVIIEHTMAAMVQLADRFLVLDHGTVLVEGAPAAVTKDRRVIEAYLGKKWSAYADA